MRLQERKLERRTFRSIDTLPIFNWWKIHQTGNFSYLLLDSNAPAPRGPRRQALSNLWDRIYDEYIERFGFAEAFMRILNKRKEITNLRNEKMQTDDMSVQTFIDVGTEELERLIAEATGKTDFYESKADMERILGFVLNPRVVTVAEFNSYISSIKKTPLHGQQ